MAVIFVSCGAIRLARFNVMALNKTDLKTSLGLPVIFFLFFKLFYKIPLAAA
jgi:phosphatidylserine synthase